MRIGFSTAEDEEFPPRVWLLFEVGAKPLHDRVGWRGISNLFTELAA
jgi:hypothetical protein